MLEFENTRGSETFGQSLDDQARTRLLGNLVPESIDTPRDLAAFLNRAEFAIARARNLSLENLHAVNPFAAALAEGMFSIADGDSTGLTDSLAGLLDDLGIPIPTDSDVGSDWLSGLDLGSVGTFSDNVIGNNAAILLTDNAQNTVNFLYVNPIEFFNEGRPSDITLNFSTGGSATETSKADTSAVAATSTEATSTETDVDLGDGASITGNVVSNNAAILMTDDAQNEVNFLYVNPIEFFNAGRSGDITINYTGSGDTSTTSTSETSTASSDGSVSTLTDDDTDTTTDTATVSEISGNVVGNNAAILLTDDAQNTVNFIYINPIEFFNGGRGSDITINIDLSGDTDSTTTSVEDGATDTSEPAVVAADSLSHMEDTFEFEATETEDTDADETGSTVISDNLVGNNGAIILTDNAQNTVNFIYINPIEFFNEGRAGDITLNINLGCGDDLVIA